MQFPLAIFSYSALDAAAAAKVNVFVQYIIQCFFISFSSRFFSVKNLYGVLYGKLPCSVYTAYLYGKGQKLEYKRTHTHSSEYSANTDFFLAGFRKRIHFWYINIQKVQTHEKDICLFEGNEYWKLYEIRTMDKFPLVK